MKEMRTKQRQPRPSVIYRFWLWSSTSKQIDGLWIETTAHEPELVFRRIEDALGLIKTYDRLRYDRLIRDLERVLVDLRLETAGGFLWSLNACELDRRFVVAETTSPEAIASLIVHEATHARLRRCGVDYEESLRARVEAVCIRRQLAFATRLPDGEAMRRSAEYSLETYAVAERLTDAAREQHFVNDAVEIMRNAEIPDWIIRLMIAYFRTLRGLHKFRLRMARGLWCARTATHL